MDIENLIEQCAQDLAKIFDEGLQQLPVQEEEIDVDLNDDIVLDCLNACNGKSFDTLDKKYEQLRSNNFDYIYECEQQIIENYLEDSFDIYRAEQKKIVIDFLTNAAENELIEKEILNDLNLPINSKNEGLWLDLFSSFYKEFVEEKLKEQLISNGYCLFDFKLNVKGDVVLYKDFCSEIEFKDWEMQFSVKKEIWSEIKKEITYPFINAFVKDVPNEQVDDKDCCCIFMQFNSPCFEGVKESDWDAFFWKLGYDSSNFKNTLNQKARLLLNQLNFLNKKALNKIESKQMGLEIDSFEQFLNKNEKVKNNLTKLCQPKFVGSQFQTMLLDGLDNKNLLNLTDKEVEAFCDVFESEQIHLNSFVEMRLEGEISAKELDCLRLKSSSNRIINTPDLFIIEINEPVWCVSSSSSTYGNQTLKLRSKVLAPAEDFQIADCYCQDDFFNTLKVLKNDELDAFVALSVDFEKTYWTHFDEQQLDFYFKDLKDKIIKNITLVSSRQAENAKQYFLGTLDRMKNKNAEASAFGQLELEKKVIDFEKIKKRVESIFDEVKNVSKTSSNENENSKNLLISNFSTSIKTREKLLDCSDNILDYVRINAFGGVGKFLSAEYAKEIIKEPNDFDDFGRNALMLSGARKNYELSRLLIEKGADVFAKDLMGNDFFDYLMNKFYFSNKLSWKEYFSGFEVNDWVKLKNDFKKESSAYQSEWSSLNLLKLASLNIKSVLQAPEVFEHFLSKVICPEQLLCVLCFGPQIENQEVLNKIEKMFSTNKKFMATFEALHLDEKVVLKNSESDNKKQSTIRL